MILSKDEDKLEATNSIASDNTSAKTSNKDEDESDQIRIPSLTESLGLIA